MSDIINPWDDLRRAVSRAKELNRACDDSANDMASLLAGRLRHVRPHWLRAMKRELRDFNIHTGEWKL